MKPTVIINDRTGTGKTLAMLEKAARSLIANSVRAEVKLLPDIEMSAAE